MYQNSCQNLSIVQFLPLWRDKRKIPIHYQQYTLSFALLHNLRLLPIHSCIQISNLRCHVRVFACFLVSIDKMRVFVRIARDLQLSKLITSKKKTNNP